MQPATFTLRRSLSGKTLKVWRKAHNLSAHALAVELGVTRQYIKSIEGGSLEASQKFIARYNQYRERLGEGVQYSEGKREASNPVTIISRFEMTATIEVLAKPVRCKGCKRWFIPITPNQKMHTTDACKKKARRKRRTKK